MRQANPHHWCVCLAAGTPHSWLPAALSSTPAASAVATPKEAASFLGRPRLRFGAGWSVPELSVSVLGPAAAWTAAAAAASAFLGRPLLRLVGASPGSEALDASGACNGAALAAPALRLRTRGGCVGPALGAAACCASTAPGFLKRKLRSEAALRWTPCPRLDDSPPSSESSSQPFGSASAPGEEPACSSCGPCPGHCTPCRRRCPQPAESVWTRQPSVCCAMSGQGSHIASKQGSRYSISGST